MSGTDSIFLYLAWGLCALGGLAALWVCLGSRSKAPHCRKCHYTLADWSPERPKCPECGRVSSGGRDLHRRRRRWSRLFIVATILLIAYSTAVIPRTQERGWVGAVPTPLLVSLRPWVSPSTATPFDRQVDGVTTQLSDEAALRDSNGEIAWLWQRVWLLRTRIAFAWEGQTGPTSRDLALLRHLDATTIRSPGPTLNTTLAAVQQAVGRDVHINVDATALSGWGIDPETHPAPVPGLLASTTLDTLTSRGVFSGNFALSWWTVRNGTAHIHGGQPYDDMAVFNSYDLSHAAQACLEKSTSTAGWREWASRDIAHLVCYVVSPERWWENGGEFAGPNLLGGRLAFVAPPRDHYKVALLLEAITSASTDSPACAGPGRGDAELAHRVATTPLVDMRDASDLASFAHALSTQFGVPCEVDTASLSLATLTPETIVPPAARENLDQRLSRVYSTPTLTPREPTPSQPSWTVRDGVIIITTHNARGDYSFIRVYDVSKFVTFNHATERAHCGLSPDHTTPIPEDQQHWASHGSLMDHLTTSIEPDQWVDNGGDQVFAMPIGTRMVVTAPATVHASIEKYLNRLDPATMDSPTPPEAETPNE